MNRRSSIFLSVGLGAALGLMGTFAVEPRIPTTPTVRGIQVAGEPLPLGADPANRVKRAAEAFVEQEVVIHHGGKVWRHRRSDLGIEVDVDATLANVLAVGHRGSIAQRLRETSSARRGEVDIPLEVSFHPAEARAWLASIADELKVQPQNARLDLANHRKVPDVLGQSLDIEASLVAIEEGFRASEPIALEVKTWPAETTLVDLADIDVSKVLATYETRFSPYKQGRSTNVELAASRIDGLLIRPGQTISFNEVVGPRSLKAGFKHAPEIVGDELTIGVGGGTCQVSTTFYGAALFGGMAIVDRRSHSRPSSYTKLGLDATVAYGKVDLKVKNPHPFPVVVHSTIPDKGLLRVEILGGEAVESVHYSYSIGGVENYVRRITVKKWFAPGKVVRHQKGTRGMDVYSTVVINFLDGRTEERKYYSGYRASPEVFWVGPDYDEKDLPDLPRHAKGVEGRLHEDGSDVYPSSG